jgi:iron-sulfur cluster assembly protein
MSDCGEVKKVFVPSAVATLPEKPIIGVEISDIAAAKIALFLQNEGKSPDIFGLRIGVVKEGCSGKSYTMALDEIEPRREAGDKIFTHNGATIMIEKLSYMFVTGSRLEYVEALTGSGFNLVNPNVKKSCACGSSFAV